jgi:hypothetical protein
VPEEIQVPTLPDVKIIDQNGKSLDTSAIDNYDSFMAFLMQASATAQLVRIRKHFDDRTSIGREQNFELNITPVRQEVFCTYPSQSFYIINDGPGQIFVELNAPGYSPSRLLVGEDKFVNFETHLLKQFNVWSAPGTIAAARAVVKF